MINDHGYRKALELAATSRHREAQKKLQYLITEQPDHIDALILLGKVEYYLKRYSSSRRRFETALTYDPGNMAAYFGIEYYRERKQKLALSAFFILILLATIFSSAFLYHYLHISFADLSVKLEGSISNEFETIKSSVKTKDNRILSSVKELKTVIERHIDKTEDSGLKLKKSISKISQDQDQLQKNFRKLSKNIDKKLEKLKQITKLKPAIVHTGE